MKGVSANPRVLLCTVYRRFRGDYPDIISRPIYRRFPRVCAPFRVSPALRFIKQNVPQVEILEYPLWQEYVNKLKEGWDVVGFSFFQNQIDDIERMADEARQHGARETWAGGYGALDYKIPTIVDRVLIGPGEDQIAQVFGYRVRDDEIEHPVMMINLSSSPGIRHFTVGLLFTTRGCPFKCKFCQNQAFESRHFTINLESIERVLAYYHRIGISNIVVLDDLFGTFSRFTDKLTRLFARYKMRWWAQSRIKFFLRYLDTWYERGLRLPAIGVETMSQEVLDRVEKKQKVDEVMEFARRTKAKPGLFRLAYYMIGYEDMTVEETLEDAMQLKQLGFEAISTSVLTPYPRTPLWKELNSKYGIFEKNYRHYDSRHLVWNHPHISPLQIQYLIKTLRGSLNEPLEFYRKSIKRLILEELRQRGFRFLLNRLIKGPIASMRIDDRKQVFFPKLIPHKKVSYDA